LQRFAVGDGTPNPFVASGEHLQAVDLANCGADVVRPTPVDRTKQVRGAHCAEAKMIDCRARDERRLGVDDRRFARAQSEAIGAGDALGIEKGVDDERI